MATEIAKFYASRKQRLLTLSSFIIFFMLSISATVFFISGKAPMLLALIFWLLTIVLCIRSFVVSQLPVALVHESTITLTGWFGGKATFDLRRPIDVGGNATEIVVTQGTSSGTISRYVLGDEHFHFLRRLIQE